MEISMKKPFVIIAGPTAVGKTELSIALAEKINGVIISADSIQVYKYMDIGSAKITKAEMRGIDHYLIDEFDPSDEFHVVKFQECAKRYMEQIYQKKQIPILVGGTGFYIQALLRDIDFSKEESDESYRNSLEALANEKGEEYLHQMLAKIDAKSAEDIHSNNRKRVIRALEFYHTSGKKISDHNEEEKKRISPYNHAYFVLNDTRELLYKKIDERVDLMIDQGLVDEVKHLKEMGYHKNLVSMQGIGYKEILKYLDGELTIEEAVYTMKRDTRHFAKRQLTWFKREADVLWIMKPEFEYNTEAILSYMIDKLKEKEIIS